jgi:hypothetical protein
MKLSIALFLPALAVLTGCICSRNNSRAIVKNVPAMSLTSPGTQYALLPERVQHTLLVYGGAAEIRDIKEISTTEPMYEVRFINFTVNPTLFVLQDGTLVNCAGPYYPTNTFNRIAPPAEPSTLDQRKKPL